MLCFIGNSAFSQDKTKFFLDEFSVSINQTPYNKYDIESRRGFGIGAYHIFKPEKKINIIVGAEYNRVSQFVKYVYEGHFANSRGITYTANYLSIPIGVRATIGNKVKFFIETGAFVDFVISSNEKGIYNSYLPSAERKFDQKANFSNFVGAYLGIGLSVPISKYEIYIKPDYKFGFSNNEVGSGMGPVVLDRYVRINLGFRF